MALPKATYTARGGLQAPDVQQALSPLFDMYTQSKKDELQAAKEAENQRRWDIENNRAQSLYDMKVEEANRLKASREALQNYEFDPATALKGQRELADEALIKKYDELNARAAKDPTFNPALTAEQAREVQGIYEQATPWKEQVQSTVFEDLRRKGVDYTTALGVAKAQADGYKSLADATKEEQAATKAKNELLKDAYDRDAKGLEFSRKLLVDATKNSSNKYSKIDPKDVRSTIEKMDLGTFDTDDAYSQVDAAIKAGVKPEVAVNALAMSTEYGWFGKSEGSDDAFNKALKIAAANQIGGSAGNATKQKLLQEYGKLQSKYNPVVAEDVEANARTKMGTGMQSVLESIFGKKPESTIERTREKEPKVSSEVTPKPVTAKDLIEKNTETYESFDGESEAPKEVVKSAFNPDGTVSIDNIDQVKEVLNRGVEALLPSTKPDREEQAKRQQEIKKAFIEGNLSADQKEWIERSTKTPNGRKLLQELGIENAPKNRSMLERLDTFVKNRMYGTKDAVEVDKPKLSQEERQQVIANKVLNGEVLSGDQQRWVDDMKKTPNGRRRLKALGITGKKAEESGNIPAPVLQAFEALDPQAKKFYGSPEGYAQYWNEINNYNNGRVKLVPGANF